MPVAVSVEPPDLVVRITGWDAVWALRRTVRVPLTQVTGAAVEPRPAVHRKGLRMAGSYVPKVLKSGSYAGWRWSEFWVTRWPERVLVVRCAPGARYDRLVLDVPDPEAVAELVRTALVR
ncbi:MAG TPA: hypothetical protein VNA20_11505 [Frankiaceae bacterium]|nr:hypothetical protein [Frankiaceae bacterium]